MKDKIPSGAGPALNIADIYYVLFRHKKKILLSLVLGFAAAAATYLLWPKTYMSYASIMIKYVVESQEPTGGDNSDISAIRNAGPQRNESFLATEVEILLSRDVAGVAATNVTKMLLRDSLANRTNITAEEVLKGLMAEPAKGSRVIRVTYSNKDPKIVQPVLDAVIRAYQEHHFAIHREAEKMGQILMSEKANLRGELRKAEEDLSKAKKDNSIFSLEDDRRRYTDQIAKLNLDLLSVKAEKAENFARFKALTNALVASVTNAVGGSNQLAGAPDALKATTPPPPDVQAEYQQISAYAEDLSKRRVDLLRSFRPESTRVKPVSAELEEVLKKKLALEEAHPGLLSVSATPTRSTIQNPNPWVNLLVEYKELQVKWAAVLAKEDALNTSLTNAMVDLARIQDAEVAITQLQRERDLKEQQYKYFATSLEHLNTDTKLARDNFSNISIVSNPSPASLPTSKLLQAVLGILAASLVFAFGLPFVIEKYLDQTLKKASDVEIKVGLPLFINMPYAQRNGKGFLPIPGVPAGLIGNGSASRSDSRGNHSDHAEPGSKPEERELHAEITPWDYSHPLRPFNEALRDRLISYFEQKNMNHKPKLVAVSGCATGAGVSTVAAGLAASLSETGEGNVLLVDMNNESGAARHFHKGDLEIGIDEALQAEGRKDAQVQDNLFVVSEAKATETIPGLLPLRFKTLLPQLKASDYDFIVFDMPPISQISITPRLAKFMDLVLMVVESERTDQEMVRRAGILISRNNPNVGIVLNKSHEYMPKKLRQPV